MKILIAILIFSLIVIVHEMGHFLLAKANGIVVNEFCLGMGPRLFGFEWKGTVYALRALPFGGACMMQGEDLDDMSEGSFGSKNAWQRISVVAAGPIFNFLLAYLLAMILIANIGYDKPVVLAVTEGYSAEDAGIEQGDIITGLGNKKIHLYREITDFSIFHQEELQSGEPIKVTWIHEGETHEAMLTPKDTGNGRYILGIAGNSNYRWKASITDLIVYSGYEVKYWIDTTFSSLKMMLRGQVRLDDMSGPVGVVDMIGETYEQSKSDGVYYIWLNMINMAILLTANLGVMNLLPIPALDGGRLLFLIIEAIRRKRLNPEIEGRIHLTGLVLLLLFMMVIMMNDVKKIVF